MFSTPFRSMVMCRCRGKPRLGAVAEMSWVSADVAPLNTNLSVHLALDDVAAVPGSR